jgi:replication factor C subunit 1
LLRGRDAGESKTKKAEKLGTKILEEDDFYKLVDNAKEKEEVETLPPPKPKGKKRLAEEEPMEEKEAPALDTLLWTEKYKPKNTSEIIGNKETIKKISTWAAEWKDNFKREFAGNDEFASKRALLISGPPGIGKSTTAGLVAKENGFEPVEFNASDVRSKKVLEQNLTEMIDNRSVTEFFHAASADTHSAKKQKTETKVRMSCFVDTPFCSSVYDLGHQESAFQESIAHYG